MGNGNENCGGSISSEDVQSSNKVTMKRTSASLTLRFIF